MKMSLLLTFAILLLIVSLDLHSCLTHNFKIGFLPAMTDKREKLQDKGNTYAGAIGVALQKLRSDPDYAGYDFTYAFNDTMFDAEVTLKSIVNMYHDGVDVYLGPENNCVMSAKLASSLNMPMIGFKCLDSVLSDKEEYATFVRTVPSNSKVTKSILALLKHYNWESFSVVRQESVEWEEVSKTLGLAAKVDNIQINSNESFPANFRILDGAQLNMICSIVKKTSDKTRAFLCLGEGINCTSDPAYIFKHLITLIHRKSTNTEMYEQFEDKVREEIAKPPFNVVGPPPPIILPISVYAAKLYDGVMLYAKAVKSLVTAGRNPRDGRELMKVILNSTYESIQQFNDTIDEKGDAEGAYSAVAVVENSNSKEGLSVQLVGTFNGLGENVTLVYERLQPMSWFGGKAPLHQPKCGFDGSLCPLEPTPIIIPLVSVVAISATFMVVIVSICSWRQYQQKKQIDSLLWKLDKSDIEIISSSSGTVSDVFNNEHSNGVNAQPHDPLLASGDANSNSSINSSSVTLHDNCPNRSESPLFFRIFGKDDEEDDDCEKQDLPVYCPVGCYKNTMLVSLRCIWNCPDLTKSVKRQLHILRELTHENINKFIGACIDPPQAYIVYQYCDRGSLEDVLIANRNLFVEEAIMQYSLINDLVKGMMFIHNSTIGCHGNLKSTKCLVDCRFVLRISGFGLDHFTKSQKSLKEKEDNQKCNRDRLWTAPELMRECGGDIIGTQKGDVYSFAIILHEILALMGPWGETRLSDRDVVLKVLQGQQPYTRPNMTVINCEEYLKSCMEECWSESPETRPDFKTIHTRKLKTLRDTIGSNILENMLERIEKYTKNLESLVDERTKQLKTEKRKTEKLLHRMLPKSVAEDLMRGKEVQASYYDCVTIYFSDIVGFTKLCSESNPYEIVTFLNELYTRFDNILNNFDVYKVETIGDAYMVVSGLPKQNGINHAGEIASMSLDLLTELQTFKIHHRPEESLKLRIGIHSGPVVVGVVGIKMPRYCLFGDTVNTTARMESNGESLRVHCSAQCKELLDQLGGYSLEERGMVDMKGKGNVLTYWLVGEDRKRRNARLSRAPVLINSACNSTRSSIDESLHLMPNGFRRPILSREHFSVEEFVARPVDTLFMKTGLRKSLRRGSMPINDIKRGSLGINLLDISRRRGSTPMNLKKMFELRSGWELKEDDERQPCLDGALALDFKSAKSSMENRENVFSVQRLVKDGADSSEGKPSGENEVATSNSEHNQQTGYVGRALSKRLAELVAENELVTPSQLQQIPTAGRTELPV